jgi:hypothetical protein
MWGVKKSPKRLQSKDAHQNKGVSAVEKRNRKRKKKEKEKKKKEKRKKKRKIALTTNKRKLRPGRV